MARYRFAIVSFVGRSLTRFGSLGAQPGEGPNERLSRQLVVFGGALMSCGGVVWGSLTLWFGLYGAAVVPFGYVLVTLVNFIALGVTGNFPRARVLQVLASLTLPFLFQAALGGIVASGLVMLWAMIALVGSLTFSSAKESVLWVIIYCGLAVVSGLVDARLAEAPSFVPSPTVVRVFFTLNVVMISAIVFGLTISLHQRQRMAITALEEGSQVNRVLTERLTHLTGSLEAQVKARTHELEVALVRAEAGTRAKSDFLATMSHEIRTPLNGILGTTELLRLSQLEGSQREYVDLIQRSGGLLLTVINDVLDFSKIEAGKLELAPRPFELSGELETVLGLHRAAADEKGVALRLERAADVPRRVVADADRLMQVIGNLLSNAVKFTSAGAIVLRVARAAGAEGETWLSYEVQDSGIGISGDALGRLFRPFSQADSSTTRRFGGTGLGLAICARLCSLMGGSISVESAPGQGTTFRVRLPVQLPDDEDAPTGESPLLPALDGPRLRVLIADDNTVNQTIGARLLAHLGCEVVLAANGEEALQRLDEGPVHLVLMDLQMPVLDGLTAARRIRALRLAQPPRIVALTANAFESDRQACLEAGMHGFLAKPLRVDALRRQLALTQRALAQAA